MNYFDMLLAKNLGGGGGGNLPFPYKVVHVKFTPPADALQTAVYANGYYDTTAKRLVSGQLFYDGVEEHSFDMYVTSITDIGEEGEHDYRWIFMPQGSTDLFFQYTIGEGQWLYLNIDLANSVLEDCEYDDDSGFVFIDDNATEATVTIAFEPIQS